MKKNYLLLTLLFSIWTIGNSQNGTFKANTSNNALNNKLQFAIVKTTRIINSIKFFEGISIKNGQMGGPIFIDSIPDNEQHFLNMQIRVTNLSEKRINFMPGTFFAIKNQENEKVNIYTKSDFEGTYAYSDNPNLNNRIIKPGESIVWEFLATPSKNSDQLILIYLNDVITIRKISDLVLNNYSNSNEESSKIKSNNNNLIIEDSKSEPPLSNMNSSNEKNRKFYVSANFLYGIGMQHSSVVEYNSGEEVTLSGGGGFGFLGSLGFDFSKHFGLSADVSWQKSVGDDPLNEIESDYTRWIIQLTPKLILPINKKHQVNLGAGPGLYFNGMIFLYTTGQELPSIFYSPAFGFHFMAEYKYNINDWLSVGIAAKYTAVTYKASDLLYNSTFYDVDILGEKYRNFDGNGLDFFAGLTVKF